MRFWDTSAVLPLFIKEVSTERVRRWYDEDVKVVVWAVTRVEMRSGFARRIRSEPSKSETYKLARETALTTYETWLEVTQLQAVRQRAEQLVESYPLRAADAMQLAAALLAVESDEYRMDFVTLDRPLATAARKEGFRVLGP